MKDTDGSVIIEVDLRTKKFEQKMKNLETKLKNEEIDLEISAGETENAKRELEQANAEYNKLKKQNEDILNQIKQKQAEYDKLNNKLKESANGGPNLTMEEYQKHGSLWNELGTLNDKQNQINVQLDKYNEKVEKASDNLSKAELKHERIKEKIDATTSSMELLNQQEDLFEIKQTEKIKAQQLKEIEKSAKETEKSLKGVNKSLKSVVNKVVRWGLAVFGVRSAYLAIRQAMSTLSQYDNNLSASLDYIRFALATSIKPIIDWIVNAIYTLLQYINYISMAWFNYNLFQNASVKNFNSMNKSAKKLQRTLAGFDEMNVLSSNKSQDNEGTPLADLSKQKSGATPEWLKWIGEAKDFILEIVPIIATIFAILFKVKKLGLYLAILGIYKTFKEIKKWLKDPTFENFMGILQGIALTVAGIAILFGAWPVAIAAALVLIVVTLAKYWDKIKEWFQGVLQWIDTDFRNWMHEHLGWLGDIITNTIYFIVQWIYSFLDSFISGLKKIYNGIIKITEGDLWGGIKEIFSGLLDILLAPFKGFIDYMKNIWENHLKKPFELLVNKIKKVLGFKVEMEYEFMAEGGGGGSYGGGSGSGGSRNAKGAIYIPPKLAVGGIINQPGRGIPLGSAIGGERGAEGVIPLTDSQQMELLGEAIGRYVSINLNNTIDLDGRVLARQINKVRQNDNFVMNR